jgi:acyl carrier protein
LSLAEINDALIALLKQQLADDREVKVATDLLSDLALESVQIMEFIVEVEDHFDIAISLEALGEIRTIEQLGALVSQTLGKQ